MRQKHAEIARIETPFYTAVIGSRAIVVTPKPDTGMMWHDNPSFCGIKTTPMPGSGELLQSGKPVRFDVIPDQALRLQYIVECARLRRIPEKSKWATKAYAFASVDAMLIDLLKRGCGTLACELVQYRGSDAPDPMDAIVMRVNHEASRAPSLEMDFFGFWVVLFQSVTLRLPRTARKTLPAWACKTGEVKFSELLPSHQVKAMAAIKRFM